MIQKIIQKIKKKRNAKGVIKLTIQSDKHKLNKTMMISTGKIYTFWPYATIITSCHMAVIKECQYDNDGHEKMI